MSLSERQEAILRDVYRDGRWSYPHRRRRSLEALERAGLITLEFKQVSIIATPTHVHHADRSFD